MLHTQEWGRQDGLPYWDIVGFFQDSRGFIWLQNRDQLLHFDGRQFQYVESTDVEQGSWSSKLYSMVDIEEDIHHNIWRYFQGAQEFRIYDPAANRHYTLPEYLGGDTPSLPLEKIRMISVDRTIYIIDDLGGTIWAYDGSLKRVFHDGTACYWEHNSYDHLTGERAVYYLPGPDQQFWIIHRKLGVMLCNEQGIVIAHYPRLSPDRFGFFIAAGNQLYYFPQNGTTVQRPNLYRVGGTEAPLAKWPSFRREFLPGNFFLNFPDDNTHFLIERSHNTFFNVWNGQREPKKLSSFFSSIGLFLTSESIDARIRFFEQTANGEIWFFMDGVLTRLSFQKKRFESIFKGRSFRDFAFLDDQTFYGLYYGKNDLVLDVFHTDGVRITPSPFVLPDVSLLSSVTIHNGETWVGSERFLAHYSRDRQLTGGSPLRSDNGLNGAHSLVFPSDRRLLYASDKGITEVDLVSRNLRYLLKGVRTNHLFEDKAGDCWAATEAGLYHLPSKRMFLDTAMTSRTPLSVVHIHEEADGSFWLATKQGLVHWKPFEKDFEQFTTTDGLSNNTLHAVYAGAGDWLWLSSDHGIMAFNRRTREVNAFFEKDGLAHSEQNWRAHGLGPDGKLYFGGINGITRFDPKDVSFDEDQTAPYAVFLQSISFLESGSKNTTNLHLGLANQFAAPFSLPASTIQLEVSIAHPSFAINDAHHLEWRIEGVSPDWSAIPPSGRLIFYGLPAGFFDLQIRAWNTSQPNHIQSLIIPFRKVYFFYQQPWFGLLAALLVVFIPMLIIRWRLRSIHARNLLLKQMVSQRTQELEYSNAEILRQKEKLERIDASKNQLFNNISHEFRTPLTLIQGYADSLLAPPGSERIAVGKPATRIKEQAKTLSRMIEEIMDLSKVQQGNIQLTKEPVEWTAFLQREFYLFESQARHKQLDYRLCIEPDAKTYLAIDTQKMERILHNLISNALKFTPAAGRILIRCTIREEEVQVVVADTGPGVPPEEQAQVFDRYFQGSAARQMAQPGYGIGLALCREYAQLMNGRLWVESLPGEGASFFLVFPRELTSVPVACPDEQPTINEAQPRTLAQLLPTEGQRRLLIVEDNAHVQEFLVEVLAGEYHISTAANGEEALAVLEREPDIDLILSDVMMPVMDGYTLLQKTRSHPVWGFIPFLMLTALTAEEGKLQALRLGVDAFLTKPFEIVELKTQIRNLIRNQQLRKAFLRQTAPASSQEKTLDTSAPVFSAISQEEQLKEESYDEHWMNELQEIVLKSMGKFEFKVSDLAFQLHISERTLRNYIKTYTGLAPSEFLQKARLDRAYQFAKDKKYRTIAEIAYAVGFKDAKHFSKLFTKEFGKSPAEFLK